MVSGHFLRREREKRARPPAFSVRNAVWKRCSYLRKHRAVALRCEQRRPMFHDTRHSRVNNRYREQIQRVSVYAFLLLTRWRAFRKNDLWRMARAGAARVESISKHGSRFSGARFENACRETNDRGILERRWFPNGTFPGFS